MKGKDCLFIFLVLIAFVWLLFHGARTSTYTPVRIKVTNQAFNLRNAISSYYTEYRRFPVGEDMESGVVELQSDNQLLKYLVPDEVNKYFSGNPRGILFFTARAARQRSENVWADGVRISKDDTELYDHYGNYFRIKIDLDMSGKIAPPDGGSPITDHVCIWSAGKDGDYTTWKDNVKTW